MEESKNERGLLRLVSDGAGPLRTLQTVQVCSPADGGPAGGGERCDLAAHLAKHGVQPCAESWAWEGDGLPREKGLSFGGRRWSTGQGAGGLRGLIKITTNEKYINSLINLKINNEIIHPSY